MALAALELLNGSHTRASLKKGFVGRPTAKLSLAGGQVRVNWESGPYILPWDGHAIDLGRFSNAIKYSRRDGMVVRCVALTPRHPRSGHPCITHPNVRHDKLCLGEARRDVYDAVLDGKLDLAMDMVDAVLANGHVTDSPYVHIREWVKQACADCGGPGEGQCTVCHRWTCLECGDRHNRYLHCCNCLHRCESCDRVFTGQRTSCPCCEVVVCPDCWRS